MYEKFQFQGNKQELKAVNKVIYVDLETKILDRKKNTTFVDKVHSAKCSCK